MNTHNDGNCSNLHRHQLPDPPVISMHISHDSLKILANTAVGSLPLADTEHTHNDDAMSNSDSHTSDHTARRVHFAKCREVRMVDGIGPHFTNSLSHQVGRVKTIQSRFESTRLRHRCLCGFEAGACECFTNVDYVSTYYFMPTDA